MYFLLPAYLCLGTKFSTEIHDVYVDFIKFMVEKVDSHTQIPSLLNSFPGTELSFKYHKIKVKAEFLCGRSWISIDN